MELNMTVEDIITLLKEEPFVIISVVIIVFILNYKSIIEFVDSRKKINISNLEEALKNKSINGLDREFMENKLVNEHFKVTTGLNVEKEFREAIIQAHKNTKGELRFQHYKWALPLLKYKNNQIKVKISIFIYFLSILNVLSSFVMFALGSVFLLFSSNDFSYSTSLPLLGLSFLFFAFGFIYLYEIRHILSAKKVSKELTKQTKKDD